jgi:hypothetical protein
MAEVSNWAATFRSSFVQGQIVALSVVLCLLLNVLPAFSGDYEMQIEKMRPIWMRYLHALHQIQCEIEVNESWKGGTKSVGLFDVEFPCVLTRGTSGKRIEAYNGKYSFVIHRDDIDSEWMLARLEKNSVAYNLDSWDFLSVSTNISQSQNSYNMIAGHTTMGLRLFPIWFPSLTMSEDFHVLGFERKMEDGLNVVIIKYRFEPNSKALTNPNRSGQVTLLEDHYYLIKSAKFEYIYNLNPEKRGVADVRNSYDFDSMFSVPVITRQETCFVENGQEDKKVVTYSGYKMPESTENNRFFLSHYGFPEPDFGDNSIGWTRFLLMAFGILLIIFALGRRMMSK